MAVSCQDNGTWTFECHAYLAGLADFMAPVLQFRKKIRGLHWIYVERLNIFIYIHQYCIVCIVNQINILKYF